MADYWGVVQPVGHRTVNADGVGSNPTAPAKLLRPKWDCRPSRSFRSSLRILRARPLRRDEPSYLAVNRKTCVRGIRRASAYGYGPLGVVFGVGGGSSRGEDRAGPALNPLKGSSARLPPSSFVNARTWPNVTC